MRKFVCSVFAVLVAVTVAVAGGETFGVTGVELVTKGEGADAKITEIKGKKGKKGEDQKDVTLTVSSEAKIYKGAFNKDTKKVEKAGDAIPVSEYLDTVKAAKEAGKGVNLTVTTNDKGAVTEIVAGGGFGKADAAKKAMDKGMKKGAKKGGGKKGE